MRVRRNNWEGGVQIETSLSGSRERHRKTFTCAHCNRVVVVPERCRPDELGALCLVEMKPVCSRPDCQVACIPFERKVEAMERADMHRRTRGY